MAPSLFNFKELRRRSRASFRTDRSTDTSSDGSHGSHGTTPTSGSLTPPSIAQQSDPALNLQLKDQLRDPSNVTLVRPRPPLQTLPNGNTNRYSVSGMSGLGSPATGRGPSLPASQYSPRITNVSDNQWAYQKVLLITGTIGEPSQHTLDGIVTVTRLDENFPPIQWVVTDSYFKAVVYLLPGPNRMRFDFSSPKLANSGSSNPIHASYLTIHMIPSMNSPPLQLAILLAKDSPGTFDSVPARMEREGNGLETAVRKFRMAAYLWQAFTAENLWRNKFGRRTFRFEEEWMTGSSSLRDRESGTMRSEARIHIIRSDKTVAEIRDLGRAQQNENAADKGGLWGIAAEAVKAHFKPLPGQKCYVSVMILDSHWDTESKIITGHAALGGAVNDDLHLAIFGSHCLQSYPTGFDEVQQAFTDCTPTDTDFVGNDCNEAGSSWEAASLGIGAHLHETGHLFGLPHQESGLMARDFRMFSRSFLTREAYSTRTKSKGGPVMAPEDECRFHRLDCLRLRNHPCFRLPNDSPLYPDDSVQAFPVEGGALVTNAPSGISFIEIIGEGDDVCRTFIEYGLEGTPAPRWVTLNDLDLRSRLPEDKRRGKMRVCIKSMAGGNLDIDDFKRLCSKETAVKLGSGKTAYRCKQVGSSRMEGSESQEIIFSSTVRQDRVLSRIIFYHGLAVDGLEFVYDDDSRQLIGKTGGKEGGDSFEMDVRRGETITGFHVRSGFYIDGIQVLTSLGRRSPIYGNPYGGSASTLIPPRGYTVCGVSGSCGAWLDGFSVLISR